MGCSASEPEVKEYLKRPISNTSSAPITTDNVSLYSNANANENKFIIPKEQLDIITKFNSNFKNANGVQLSTLSKYQLLSSKENTSIISISTNEKYIKCLNGMNFISSNIDEDKNYMLLKSTLSKMNKGKSDYLKEFHINISQKIFSEYNFIIKLKSIKRNEYDKFEFNSLGVPILVIFFDIVSYPAIEKIKEIFEYKSHCEKDFLFLPIMNVFAKETDDLATQKQFLSMSQLDDCYILTHPVNSNYIKLFQLDTIESAKTVIINCNSEIAFLSNEKIEFLSMEIIEFYLHTRNSVNTNDYFTEESKNRMTNILKSDQIYKTNIEKIAHEFKIQILFQEIENKKYPVHVNIMYNYKDEEIVREIISKINNDMKGNVKKFFMSVYQIKQLKTEMIDAFEYINNLLIDNKLTSDSSNYTLDSEIVNCGNGNKNKKYILNYSLLPVNDAKFSKIYEIFSLNLYNNPQFAKLGVGYNIIPTEGVGLAKRVKNCKIMKLFKTKKEQIEYEDNNKFVDYEIHSNYLLLMNPNFFVASVENKEKVIKVLELFKRKQIAYTICIFSYNETDTQKLRYLNYDELFDLNSKNDIIFLCSSDIENYSYFKFYSEDINFMIFHIDTVNSTLKTLFDMSTQSYESLLQYIDKEILSKEKKVNEDYLKRTKGKVMQFYNTKVKEKSPSVTTNKIFSSFNMNLIYRKGLYFDKPPKFSSFDITCHKIFLSIVYMDYLSSLLQIDQFEKEMQKDSSSIFSHKFQCLKTESIPLPKNKIIQCSRCKSKLGNEDNDSFYLCLACKDTYTTCEKCFNEISITKQDEEEKFFQSLIMSSDSVKPPSSVKEHEHDLAYLYKPRYEYRSLFISEVYAKYRNSNVKNSISLCSFCDAYIYSDAPWLNVVLSHIKKSDDTNIYKEIFICDSCFDSRKYKEYENEYEEDNVIILRRANRK